MGAGRRLAVLALVSTIVAAALLALTRIPQAAGPGFDPDYCVVDAGAARSFLEHQYVECVGLLRAAVRAAPDSVRVYVANDNLLAAAVLEALGSPLAASIQENTQKYGGGWNGKVDVLLGRGIPEGFYAATYRELGEACGYRVLTETVDTSRPLRDWREYADLLVYHALNSLLNGDLDSAEEDYRLLTAMWDGHGIRDKPARESGAYETYKCALAIYLHRALKAAGAPVVDEHESMIEQCLETVKTLQAENGGFTTHYTITNGRVTPAGDTNTETTSIVILSLCTDLPEQIVETSSRPLP